MPIVIFILIAGLIIAGIIFGALTAKKRREELSALAARLGLQFSAADDYGLAKRFAFLDALAVGDNRYGFNIL